MRLLILAILVTLTIPATAHTSRSHEVAIEFQREHPCPSTGLTYGHCPGYIKDHIVPLCAGGADATWNMQWQTTQAAHEKDLQEWAQCRHKH
jgi:hypothetical protein